MLRRCCSVSSSSDDDDDDGDTDYVLGSIENREECVMCSG